jgi:hypothetical protein
LLSFQREATLLETNRVDASKRIRSLELQNKQLNNELEKVMNEHNSLYRSSVELHDSLTKEGMDNLALGLRKINLC